VELVKYYGCMSVAPLVCDDLARNTNITAQVRGSLGRNSEHVGATKYAPDSNGGYQSVKLSAGTHRSSI
jgi:hypothetical protein